MPRYFLQLSYDGTDFAGWQVQNNAETVQGTIEQAISTLLGHHVPIVGCGRTDTGVHASNYYAHIDTEFWNPELCYKLNAILPKSISINDHYPVTDEAHARFDAQYRQYDYFAHFDKNPFKGRFSSYIVSLKNVSVETLNETVQLIASYDEFYPFCKSNHDAHTLQCNISVAKWTQLEDGSFQLTIGANRFLRGMVRLIVGACINVALQKIDIAEIKEALDLQVRLNKPWSVPGQGLFLSKIEYPDSIFI